MEEEIGGQDQIRLHYLGDDMISTNDVSERVEKKKILRHWTKVIYEDPII